jgi:hypothetical protein
MEQYCIDPLSGCVVCHWSGTQNETINGLITMRAFGETDRFQDKCGDNVNFFTRTIMCQATIGRWLSVR